jgi:micrococcal nuclease
VNRFLNLLVRKLLHALMARRGVSLAVLVLAGALAGWGSQYGHRDVGAASTAGPTGSSYPLAGRVAHVTDGDTFNLLVNGRELRVRLASIDAPETGNSKKQRPGQPYAQASRSALAALIAGKSITVQC